MLQELGQKPGDAEAAAGQPTWVLSHYSHLVAQLPHFCPVIVVVS